MNIKTFGWLTFAIVAIGFLAYSSHMASSDPAPTLKPGYKFPVVKTDAQWKHILSADTYNVTRHAGTEAPFSGKYAESNGKGIYVCADCGNPLFSSDTKFDSGTGWPSYWQPLTPHSVLLVKDGSLGMERTEVICARCGAHLGHVFTDGPKPTGLRYCMNSVALDLKLGKTTVSGKAGK